MSIISRNRWRVSIGMPRSRKHHEVRVRFLRSRSAPPAETVVVPRVKRSVRVRALLSVGILLLACVVPLSFAVASHTAGAASVGAGGQANGSRGDVIANLFEWNWNSVAHECTSVLGPAGYGGVQVAPPQDSLSRQASAGPPVHPWWEVYQPVDYNLTSRMGNEAQFKSMVATCRSAGVKVYVDAVINHMTGQGNISYGGVHYSKYDYTGIYTSADFHHYPADCPTPDGNIDDFNNYLQVTKCELVSLADLRTESNKVRDTLAAYLNKLLSYGVSGFRVDASKHIGQTDLTAIESRLNRTVDGTRPYLALEVPPGGPGKLAPQAFEGEGSLLGFDFAGQIESAFKSYTQTPIPGGNITALQVFGEASGLLPSNKALVFVENHDSERNGSTLSYKDGPTNTIATEFRLVEMVCCQKNRVPIVAQASEVGEKCIAACRVERSCWFVEKQHRWVVNESNSEIQPLLHAAGEGRNASVSTFREANASQHSHDPTI